MKQASEILGLAMGLSACAGGALAAPNWAAAPARPIALFYPGQSSWEWALTTADHPGADKFKAGKTCGACHEGDQVNMGGLIASGRKNEPTPIAGKPPTLNAKVQFSHDDQYLYARITFAEGAQPNARMDPTTATKVTLMLAGPGVPEAARAGCWATCHEDSAGMPAAGTATRTLYLGKTRAQLTRQGGGDVLKPAPALEALKAGGYQVDYWQARLNPGAPAVGASGIVFDRRAETKPSAVTAQASEAGGTWTVTLARKLAAPGALPIEPGKRYAVSLAIHAGHTAHRFHYVSFEHSLVLDQGVADFVVK